MVSKDTDKKVVTPKLIYGLTIHEILKRPDWPCIYDFLTRVNILELIRQEPGFSYEFKKTHFAKVFTYCERQYIKILFEMVPEGFIPDSFLTWYREYHVEKVLKS